MISVAVVQKIRFAMNQLLEAKDYCTSMTGNECIVRALSACEEAHEMLIGYKLEGEERV